MPDVQTKVIPLEGGIIKAVPPAILGMTKPGALFDAVNYEPGRRGGYRRISGYAKYDSNAVTGTGAVLGVCVYGAGVIACRGQDVYASSGSGWTKINGTDTRPGVTGRYRFETYDWVTPSVIMVDSVNYPAKWDGTTFTVLTDAPQGTQFVVEFKNHMFYLKDQTATHSEPNDETQFVVADGAGALNVGFPITGAAKWRDELYIFGANSISKITGNNSSDFAVVPVSNNVGCIAPDTIQEFSSDLVYMSNDGFRTVAGTDRIGDVDLAIISKEIDCTCANLRENYEFDNIVSVLVRSKSQYRVFGYSSSETDDQARGLLMGLRYQTGGEIAREWFRLTGIRPYCADSGYVGDDELVVFGSDDGYVYQMESGSSFDGGIIDNYFYTPELSFDDPTIRKTVFKAWVEVEIEGTSAVRFVTVLDSYLDDIPAPPSVLINESSGTIYVYDATNTLYDDVAIYDAAVKETYKINLVGSGFRIAFGATQEIDGASFTVKSFIIEYAMAGRQ